MKLKNKIICLLILLILCLVIPLSGCEQAIIVLDTSEMELTLCKGYVFDWSKLKAKYLKGENSQQLTLRELMISGLNTEEVGQQEVTVTYKKAVATFSVNVIDADKVLFFDGEDLLQTQIVQAGQNATEVPRQTTDAAYFEGWFLDDIKFDFSLPIDVYTELRAKYLTVDEYALRITEDINTSYNNWLLPEQKHTYLSADYKKLQKVYEDALASLSQITTISDLDKAVGLMETALGEIPTASEKISEYEAEKETKIRQLEISAQKEIAKYIKNARELVEGYEGGAPTPDYIYYQMTAWVEMYIDN